MLWEKIMLGQVLNRPAYEPRFVAKSSETHREINERPAFMTAHDEAPHAILARVRDRFMR